MSKHRGHPLTDVGQQTTPIAPGAGSPSRCWADVLGSVYGCKRDAATDIGLCHEHYEEIVR